MLSFLTIIDDEVTRSKLEQIYLRYKKVAYWTAYSILKDWNGNPFLHKNLLNTDLV